MNAKVARRVINGLGANAYGQGITIIVQLIGVPVLLHAWGVQLYGEWLILFAIPAYLSIADLGFSQSAANDMIARIGAGDRAGALAVFQSLVALVYAIVGIGLVLSAAVLWRLPLHDWLNFQAIEAGEARWVLWLLAAQIFAALLDGVNHAGFRAAGDYALHISLYNTTRFFQFAGAWTAALAGGGPVVAAAAFFGVRAVAVPAFTFLLISRHRWLRFGLSHARPTELSRLFTPALANMAIPLAHAVNVQGMVLMVGAVIGPLAVVLFSTLRTLTRIAFQLVLSVSHAIEPELAAAYGTGDRALMHSLFVHALRAGLWLAIIAATGLALLGGFVLDVWTNGKIAMEPVLFGWLLGSAVASVLWYTALIVLKAANRHLRAASLYVLASGSAVALALFLLNWTADLTYAGVALLAMDTAMVLFTMNRAAHLLSARPLVSLAQAINPRPLMVSSLRHAYAWGK